MLSALIGAAGSIVGGMLGKPKAQAPRYVVPEYQQIRDKAEAAGFNPLTALTSAPGSVGNYTYQPNTMGEAISNAALLLADSLDPEKAARVENLELQNKDLKKRLEAATIRPAGPGLYAGRVSYGPLPGQGGSGGQASGRSDGVVPSAVAGVSGALPSAAPDSLRSLPQVYPTDPRREVDHKPNSSTSGWITVDNPWFDFPLYFPTTDGDEAAGITDIPRIGLSLAGSWLYHDYLKREARNRELNPNGPRYVDTARLRVMSQQDHARGEGMMTADERRDLQRFSRRYQLAKPNPNRTLFGVPYTSR